MLDPVPSPSLSLRIRFGADAMLGPGKAALLAGVADTGSIAAAARSLGMSYKRAWLLIETLNTMFDQPLVDSARGGPGKGGAVLSDRGRAVLAIYREVERAAAESSAGALATLQSWRRVPDSPASEAD